MTLETVMNTEEHATLQLVMITICALCCSIASIGGTAAALEGLALAQTPFPGTAL